MAHMEHKRKNDRQRDKLRRTGGHQHQFTDKSSLNGIMLPMTTVQRTSNRVRGRRLAVLSITGLLLGLFLSTALYLFNLVQMIKPLHPPGDPTASLEALNAMCELIDPIEVSIPAIETVAAKPGAGIANATAVSWAPHISKSKAMMEIAMEQYRAAQSIEPRADPQVHNILLITKPLDGKSAQAPSQNPSGVDNNEASDPTPTLLQPLDQQRS